MTPFIKILPLLLILSGFLLMFCDRSKYDTADCSVCLNSKSDSGDLLIDLTINTENPRVPIVVYKGKADEKVIEYVDTASTVHFDIRVPLNEYYSVSAEYKSDGKVIIAISGDEIKLHECEDSEDGPCWTVTGGYITVELKNK